MNIWVDYTGHVEVCEVGVSSGVQQCVGRFNISVDDTLLSQVLESKTKLSHVESYTRY